MKVGLRTTLTSQKVGSFSTSDTKVCHNPEKAVKVWKKITDYPSNVQIARELIAKHGPDMSGLALFTMLANSKAKLVAQ